MRVYTVLTQDTEYARRVPVTLPWVSLLGEEVGPYEHAPRVTTQASSKRQKRRWQRRRWPRGSPEGRIEVYLRRYTSGGLTAETVLRRARRLWPDVVTLDDVRVKFAALDAIPGARAGVSE